MMALQLEYLQKSLGLELDYDLERRENISIEQKEICHLSKLEDSLHLINEGEMITTKNGTLTAEKESND